MLCGTRNCLKTTAYILLVFNLCVVVVCTAESTYAGDRDFRFLNCAVPCEFQCTHPDVDVDTLLRKKGVKKVLIRSDAGIPADLFPQGKQNYTASLESALDHAYKRHNKQSTDSLNRTSGGSQVTSRAIPNEHLPTALRLTRWSCQENCRYECMHENSRLRLQNGEQQVHYFGKWPFVRFVGVQELLSSSFSLLNGLPYLWCLFCCSKYSEGRSAKMWSFFLLVAVNTWIQSAIFHARDMPETEVLDYHGATLFLAVTFGSACLYNLPETWPMKRALFFGPIPVFTFWVSHVCYLHLVKFDYGHNMKFAVGLGTCASIMWVVWGVRNWRKKKNGVCKLLFAILGPYLVLPFELLDFPPVLGVLDAHACWHLATVPMSCSWASFIRDELYSETRREKSE